MRYLTVFWEDGQFRRAKSSWNERNNIQNKPQKYITWESETFLLHVGSLFGAPSISDFWVTSLLQKVMLTQSPSPFLPPFAPRLATWRWGAAWQNVVTWRSSNSPNIVFMNFQTGFFVDFDGHQPKKLEKSFKEHTHVYVYTFIYRAISWVVSKHCNTGWRKIRLGFSS